MGEQLEKDPGREAFELLSPQEFTLAFQLSMNKSQVEACIIAYGYSPENARANAWKCCNRDKIVNATNYLRSQMADQRLKHAILTREEALGYVARVVRTPLAQVDEHDALCTEMVTTVKGDSVRTAIKKPDPLKAIQIAASIEGWNKQENVNPDTPITDLLKLIGSSPGMPEERDVTPEIIQIDSPQSEEAPPEEKPKTPIKEKPKKKSK